MPINWKESKPGQIAFDSGDGTWTRINAHLWRAPDGDAVSVQSMTLELRYRLGANELDTATDRDAAHQLRTILER